MCRGLRRQLLWPSQMCTEQPYHNRMQKYATINAEHILHKAVRSHACLDLCFSHLLKSYNLLNHLNITLFFRHLGYLLKRILRYLSERLKRLLLKSLNFLLLINDQKPEKHISHFCSFKNIYAGWKLRLIHTCPKPTLTHSLIPHSLVTSTLETWCTQLRNQIPWSPKKIYL